MNAVPGQEVILQRIFRMQKPLIGDIHCAPCPVRLATRTRAWTPSSAALADAQVLCRGRHGRADHRNYGDIPFLQSHEIGPEIIAAMAVVVKAVSEAVHLPYGINLLANSVIGGLAIAKTTGARFIRVNHWVKAYVSNDWRSASASRIFSPIQAVEQGMSRIEARRRQRCLRAAQTVGGVLPSFECERHGARRIVAVGKNRRRELSVRIQRKRESVMTLGLSRRGLMGAAAALGLAAVSGAATAQDKPTYALVQINQQALFFNQMNEGAQKAADEVGAELVIFNANDDPAAQNDAIETYIQQKVDGIIVVAIDVNGVMPAVQAADAAGIPVVAVDAILPEGPQKAQIGVDNAEAGKMMGEFFLKYVGESMGGSAKLGIVGALNSFIQNVRQKGFEDAITGNDKVTMAGVVDGRNVQDSALSAAENLITGNPDLTAIYATGEPALLGAIAAVESQGKQDGVKIFGWDLTAQAIKGIDDGFVVGVIQQDPAGMGAAAVKALDTLQKGGTIEKNISVPVTLVTKENVEPYRSMFQ